MEFDYFIFNKDWNSYFNKIKNIVAKANPEFNFSDIRIVISREEDLNAFSVGDGTIIVNIGLLKNIETESELVFVLCHEFSHFLLNHSDSAIYKRLVSRNSAAYKAKIKALENAKTDQITKLKKFIKEDIYMERRNSRQAENQADSFRLILMLNTEYASAGSLAVIKLLQKNSKEPGYPQLNIFNYLNRAPVSEKASNFIKASNTQEENDDEEIDEPTEKVMLDSSLLCHTHI